MNTLEIILISAAFAVVGIRLYQKYVKKNQGKPATGKTNDSTLSYSSKDDEYEPYSKK
jgi:Tfp pilus assembly major pilin PilA